MKPSETQIPGPWPWPLVGNLPNIDLKNSVRSISDISKQYGPICKIRLAGNDNVFVSGHELANELCSRKDFVKHPTGAVRSLRDVMSEGLFTAYHDEWFWGPAHRILVPAFGPISIKTMFPEMHDIATQMVLRWARFGEEQVIDATSDFTRLTIDTLSLCGMDTRLNSFYKDDLHPFIGAMVNVLVESANRSGRPAWLTALYRNANKKFDQENEFIHQVAREVLQKRRAAHQPGRKDLLDAMLNGKDPATGKALTEQTIVDNLITFMMAGHETTACMLGFFFALVLQHPEAYAKVQNEVDTVIGTRPITADDVSRVPYIKACLREALRLYPPTAGFSVTPWGDDLSHEPVILGGKWPIQKKQSVFILLTNLHRDPAAWGPDADEFRPERMLDENFKSLPPGCYKPFGNGLRGCIGSEFAMQESLLAVAVLFQKFDFRFADPEYKLVVKQTLTLKPQDLFIHAKLRPGISVLNLQRDMLHGSPVTEPSNMRHDHSQDALDKKQLLPLTIFYGSNTGTCKGLADMLAMTAPQRGFQASVRPLDDSKANIPRDRPVVFITSTMYEGQAPDNGAKFVEWLETDSSPVSLHDVHYAVFGCGSTDWKDTYQRIAINIDELMQKRGAKAVALRGETDVTEGSILSDFDAWQADHLWPGVSRVYGTEQMSSNIESSIDPVQISAHSAKAYANVLEAEVTEVKSMAHKDDRPKYHMEIRLPDSVHYMVGDYLEVYPENSAREKETLMAILRSRGHDLDNPLIRTICSHLELHQQASLKQIGVLIDFCANEEERGALEVLAKDMLPAARRPSIIQLLKKYPSVDVPLKQLVTMLPPIRPRQYSISSSPMVSPNYLTITWSLITHEAPESLPGETPTLGLASHFLSGLQPGDTLSCSIRPGQSRFSPPADPVSTPMIMVCAGTGLAPFRAFIQDRGERLRRDPGVVLAPALLYVGCRSPRDALYAGELQNWQDAGVVEVRYAYSQIEMQSNDPVRSPRYVQDRVWSEREDLVRIWEDGAKVYVCGSRAVSHGVRDVIRRIYGEKAEERCGPKSDVEIDAWWVEILRERYAVEVF